MFIRVISHRKYSHYIFNCIACCNKSDCLPGYCKHGGDHFLTDNLCGLPCIFRKGMADLCRKSMKPFPYCFPVAGNTYPM